MAGWFGGGQIHFTHLLPKRPKRPNRAVRTRQKAPGERSERVRLADLEDGELGPAGKANAAANAAMAAAAGVAALPATGVGRELPIGGLVMGFPNQEDVQTILGITVSIQERNKERESEIKRSMQTCGMYLKAVRTPSDMLYQITAPQELLLEGAQTMKLNKAVLESYGGGFEEFKIKQLHLFTTEDITSPKVLTSAETQRVLMWMIEKRAKVDIGKYLRNGCMSKLFPLHDSETVELLRNIWATFKIYFSQPLDMVRDYFGPHVAFYYAWLGYYSTMLVIASFFGSSFFYYQMTHEFDNKNLIYFAIFIPLWSTVFIKGWRRHENVLKDEWGLWRFEEQETSRPQFQGQVRQNPISGLKEKHYAWWKRYIKYFISGGIIFCLMGFAFVFMMAVFILKDMIFQGNFWGNFVATVIYAVLIIWFNQMFGGVAAFLNDWENHRTDTDYEDMLIAKVFVFQFVNSYLSLFFIAFVKEHFDVAGVATKCSPTCFEELAFQLCTVMVTAVIFSFSREMVIPYLKLKFNEHFVDSNLSKKLNIQQELEMLEGDDELTQEEINEILAEIHAREEEAERNLTPTQKLDRCVTRESLMGVYSSNFDDFNELAVQFGYVCLFAVAFPLAPLISLLNNWIQIRSDAFKMCEVLQRPMYKMSGGVGTWGHVLDMISICGVLTNVAVVGFTSESYNTVFSSANKFWFVVASEHALAAVRFLFMMLFSDVPEEIKLRQMRMATIKTDREGFFEHGAIEFFHELGRAKGEERKRDADRRTNERLDRALESTEA
eukprot:gnl/Spiro4/11778_TR6221_c0_g1_i1.p1 gnl/Spiro4/11778_TR6221_c0_g1~~gnl/Spiro4/11778_TR6221_c0_g1_i1.p1  ORF type:complete len:778 (+),score=279.70 gnl/Spiro4/11778_TR6221_c0_g1_i1:85-2418(+)